MKITAPLRIDLCGGVTDIPEIASEGGTCITNIGVRVYDDPEHNHERAIEVEVAPTTSHHALSVNGSEVSLSAVSSEYELFRRTAAFLLEHVQEEINPLSIAVRNTLPRGTGLGGSAVVSSCIFGAVDAWLRGGGLSNPDVLIRRAHEFETTVMGIAGGFQDYIGTYFGGANFIDFTGLRDVRLAQNRQLGMDVVPELRELIDSSMVLVVATDRNQNSGDIVKDEVRRFRAHPNSYFTELDEVCEHNRQLGAMACGQLPTNAEALGASMQRTWTIQKKLSPLVGRLLAGLEPLAQPYVYGLHGPGAGGNSLALLAKPGAKADLVGMLAHIPDTIVLYPRVSPGIEVVA